MIIERICRRGHCQRRLFMLGSAALAASVLTADLAFAHAHLLSSLPAEGAIAAPALPALELTFNEAIEVKFSGAAMTASDASPVPLEAPVLKAGDSKTLIMALTKPLAAGTYAVAWHALSRDGHKVKGTFKFTVKP